MSNILEQYNDYYKHKHEYQEKIDNKVLDKKRKNDNWPYPKDEEYKPNFKLTGDIKNEIKKIKSNPEIIFSDKGRKLTAVCGANGDCAYEKEIPLPNIYQFDKIKIKLRKEIEKLKSEIIRWKLNLLYNLDNEEVVLREFNEIKEKLSFKQKKLNKIISIQKKKFVFTVDNKEEQVDMNMLCVVCCVVCGVLCVVLCVARCVLRVVCGVLCVAYCVLCVVCCVLCVACCVFGHVA